MVKTLAPLLLIAVSVPAAAADFADLQRLSPLQVEALSAPRLAAPSMKAAARFLVEGNAPLLADFRDRFGYKNANGAVHFGHRPENLRYFRLTAWPRRLLVTNEDHTLPDFHNFLVLDPAAGSETAYARVYHYDSQKATEKYTADTLPESLCRLDPACAKTDLLKKAAAKAALSSVTAWEAPYAGAIKAAVTGRIAAQYDSGKFSALTGAELAAAKARLAALVSRAGLEGGGKAGLLAENSREWRVEYCSSDIATFFEQVKQAPQSEQERLIQRCSLVLDAEWLIKKDYDALALGARDSACAAGSAAPADSAYCAVFNAWDKQYRRATAAQELRLENGALGL